jgi:chromosome segregation ATPase
MAKLSDLFGRKGITAGADKLSGRNGSDPISVESLSDVGSRMGEENEALRNLLSDTGRKISELDDLKEAFDKLVQPFNSTLRALEQEKSQTMSLSGMLAESRTAYETLRTEFYQVERKATALEAEVERLREDLELSREANRALESNRLELTDDINARRAHISELDRQLAQETTQRRALGEARRTLQEQFDAAEKRIVELEGELAAAREKLTLLEDEKRSLQIAVDQALNETARLTRRLTESENTLTATRAQLGKVESSFAEAYAERGRLGAALDEAKEQHQAERNSLNMRLDALHSRAATAERLLSEARQNLIARTEEVRAFDRKSVEATIARNNSEKRLAQIEGVHEARERQIKDHEQARVALTERNNALTKTLKVRETGLARLEEKIAALTERNGHLEADIQVSRTNIEKRVEDLNSALQRERMERAVVEGALEAARKDNFRLQSEVAALRSTLRRGAPLEETPVPPVEAANDEAPPKSKKGRNADHSHAEAGGKG